MCLAICNPDGRLLDYSEMERAFKSNPDGAGFAFADNGEVIVSKGYFKFDELWSDYCDTVGVPSILHFRWATHGKVTHRNCHPFQVNKGLAMAHNGVLPTRSTAKKSDTHCLVLDVVRPLADLVFDDLFQQSMESHIGTGNKLVFLNGHGDHKIYNETQGHWRGGVWYSNYCYREWTPKSERWYFPALSQKELDAIPWKYTNNDDVDDVVADAESDADTVIDTSDKETPEVNASADDSSGETVQATKTDDAVPF